MSKTQDAIDYMTRNPGTTQYAAAKKFNIGQSAVSVTLAKNEIDVCVFQSVGADTLDKVSAKFISNPGMSSASVAKFFDLSPNTLRAAYRGREILARRAMLAQDIKIDDHTEGKYSMREQCAKMVEMVGGEHAASIALAVRSIPL